MTGTAIENLIVRQNIPCPAIVEDIIPRTNRLEILRRTQEEKDVLKQDF